MIVGSQWVAHNLGFDPIKSPRTFVDVRVRAGSPVVERRGPAARDHRFRFGIAGGTRVPGVHDRNRALAIHGRAVARKVSRRKPARRPAEAATTPCPAPTCCWSPGPSMKAMRSAGADAGQGLPQRLSPVHAQLRGDFREDAPRLPRGRGEAIGGVLDHRDRWHVGARVQVRLAHVAGRPGASEHRRLAADHRRGAAQARADDRDRGRDRQAVRSGRCRSEPGRALRLHLEVQTRALSAGPLRQCCRRGRSTWRRRDRFSGSTRRSCRGTIRGNPRSSRCRPAI